MDREVTIDERSALIVVAKRMTVAMPRIGGVLGASFGEVYGHLGRIGVAPGGPPFVIYHSEPRDGAIDLEVCAPVGSAVPAPAGWHARELPAGTFATLVHVGPYDTVGVGYEHISGWIADHGYEIAGPPREIYLDPPDTPPDRTRTIIEFPVTVAPVPLPAG
jgi:effector-binding domain-containing protein